MERIIVAKRMDTRLQVSLIEDGRLCEYWEEGAGDTAGRIVKGRVERVVPGMQAAFVRIGLEKNGFLPLNERPIEESEPLPPIRAGEEVLVQVKKAPCGQKGAYLTRAISLVGEFVLVLPQDHFIGVSARIEEADERARLFKMGEALLPENCGLVMRAASACADCGEVAREISRLVEKWRWIQREAAQHAAPYWLTGEKNVIGQMVKDYAEHIDKLVTDDPDAAHKWEGRLAVVLDQKGDLDEKYRISKEVGGGLCRKAWLKSGGYLVIDPCEAMTVIDVNTGKFTGKHQLEETALQLNLEACGEIARQTRLRNLSGIILIDFIDLEKEEHRAQVLERLTAEFQKDRIKTVIHGFTSLGLMEMTRKKISRPLLLEKAAVCPRCHGEGYVVPNLEGGMEDA